MYECDMMHARSVRPHEIRKINILTDIRWHTFVSRYDNYRFTRALLEYLQKTSFQPNSSQYNSLKKAVN